MNLEDWHTHSALCHHAVGTIEDYVKQAIKIKLKTIGISDHFPYEFLKKIDRIPFGEYAMKMEETNEYLTTIDEIREKYMGVINVRSAFEIDFFEDQESALNQKLKTIMPRLDYVLGSIHILDFNDGRGSWGFDDGRFLKDYRHYGTDAVYLEYFSTVKKMLESSKFDFDIISHFDLPKKFGDRPSEKKKEVQEVSRGVLDLVKQKDVAMEVNTSGFRKDVGEQYPGIEYLKQMHELDIPILLGSDAHDPLEVGWEFEKMIKILKEIGFTKLAHYEKRKRRFIDI